MGGDRQKFKPIVVEIKIAPEARDRYTQEIKDAVIKIIELEESNKKIMQRIKKDFFRFRNWNKLKQKELSCA